MTEKRSAYAQLLLDPRWQRRRLEILSRSDFSCESCGTRDKTLHVHHTRYLRGKMPWEYEDRMLLALCEICHQERHDHSARLLDLLAVRAPTNIYMPDVVSFLAGFLAYAQDEETVKILMEFVAQDEFGYGRQAFEEALKAATNLYKKRAESP